MRSPGRVISINDADALLQGNAGEGSLSLDRTYTPMMKQAALQLAIGPIRLSSYKLLRSKMVR